MQIVQNLAGYTMGQADNIRRAMSKKKQYVIDAERQNFVYGNEEQGISSLVKENCDNLTVIPSAFMLPNPNEENWDIFPVESLNVAQAASVILYDMSKES